MPRSLTRLNRATGTPLLATLIGIVSVLFLALAVPLAGLADLTARFTLAIFSIVNLSLIVIKRREAAAPPGIFVCPLWVPIAGMLSSVVLLGLDLFVN